MPITQQSLREAAQRASVPVKPNDPVTVEMNALNTTIQRNLENPASFLQRAASCSDQTAEPASIKPISTLDTTAAPKDSSFYTWFAYTGAKPLTLTSQGGSKLILDKGDKFGTRASGSGKFIRLIGEKTGVNKVFTLAFDDIAALIKNCKPA